ncbi:DUF4397 domain-containing protein [Clostridium ihumii]|uniref:DUF4397 domain-containing protein n=1 Tax=Clostridium ihumii TaxID=1470356 RepID=UPI000686E9DA|nr:DUF4397 domain-containing protein [Clostridium ihumii]
MYFRDDSIENNNKNQIVSYIRLLHASPNAPKVTVLVNNLPFVKDFEYTEFTDYVKVLPGKYNVKIVRNNNPTDVLYDTVLDIPKNKIFTVAAIGKFPDDFELFPIEETYSGPVNDNKVYFKVVNLIPDGPSIDLTTENNILLFSDVMEMEVENYKELSPRKYNMTVKLQNTDIDILYVPNIYLRGDKFYTMYLVGILNGTPGLEALIPLDGITYLKH